MIAKSTKDQALVEDDGKRNAVPGEWLVRIHPVNVLAIKGMAE